VFLLSTGKINIVTFIAGNLAISNRKPFEPIKDTKEGNAIFKPGVDMSKSFQEYRDSVDPTLYWDSTAGTYQKKKPAKQILRSEQLSQDAFSSSNQTRADISTGGKVMDRSSTTVTVNVDARGSVGLDGKKVQEALGCMVKDYFQAHAELSGGH
jgi:hypothetical protein